MNPKPDERRQLAFRNAVVAREAFVETGRLFASLPENAWNGPTGCDKWDMWTLAGHVVGEAVWFANLVHGVTRAEPALAGHVYEDLKQLPAAELARRTEEAGRAIQDAVEEATDANLEVPVDLGWTDMPLWMATSVAVIEGAIHNWDARVGRDPSATIPVEWAKRLAPPVTEMVPMVARAQAAQGDPVTFQLDVADGIGPKTIRAAAGQVSIEGGSTAHPDVTLRLTADQYVRLLTGRFDLSTAGDDAVIEGPHDVAQKLNSIFAGIANED